MISSGKLARTVFRNSMRSPSEFVLSAFGIVVGIAAYVFFLALALGVRDAVIDVFPLDQVEVVSPRTSFLGADTTKRIDDAVVAQIKGRPEVKDAVPRMAIGFPTVGWGTFQGVKLRLELVGDGIDPDFVTGETFSDRFKDWETAEPESALAACGEETRFRCEGGVYYCDRRINKCRHRVPMLVHQNLIEIYNKQFANTHDLPVIGGLEQFALKNLRVHVGLGDSMFGMSGKQMLREPYEVEGVLLGVSDKAIPIGVTVPIEYVRRWNKEFLGDEAAKNYSSIIVRLHSKDDVARFGSWIVEALDMRLEDQQGERFAMVIVIVTGLFLLISLVIVTISAINIAHNFFMQVSERKREIGIMRAVGATRSDVRRIILGEAALIGIVAGIAGVAIAFGAGLLADLLASRYLPSFAFKPKSFFDFAWWIPISGLAFAVLFCIVGGFLPARRAAKLPPARSLVQQ